MSPFKASLSFFPISPCSGSAPMIESVLSNGVSLWTLATCCDSSSPHSSPVLILHSGFIFDISCSADGPGKIADVLVSPARSRAFGGSPRVRVASWGVGHPSYQLSDWHSSACRAERSSCLQAYQRSSPLSFYPP